MSKLTNKELALLEKHGVKVISFDELAARYQEAAKWSFASEMRFGSITNKKHSCLPQCLFVSLDDFQEYFLSLPENYDFHCANWTTEGRSYYTTYEYNWHDLLRQQYYKGELPLSDNDALSLLSRRDQVYVFYVNDDDGENESGSETEIQLKESDFQMPERMVELNRHVALLFL